MDGWRPPRPRDWPRPVRLLVVIAAVLVVAATVLAFSILALLLVAGW